MIGREGGPRPGSISQSWQTSSRSQFISLLIRYCSRPTDKPKRVEISIMSGNKKRRDGSASSAMNDAPQIGEVGYEFRKLFNEGWFQGKVVKIRPGAAGGRDRRVVYSVSTNDQ